MKRRFSILTAALALLAFLVIPMGMKGQSTYTKVTTAPSDWSGTYVIVADASNVIFTGQSGSNTYGGYADVTISDGSVTGSFSAYEVEIEQSGTYYSIKHINSSKYLGWISGNTLAFSTSAPTTDSYRWVLSTNSILNVNDNTRKLQYNSGSPRFACYTSSQKVAYLYKKEAGSTPTCATPTFNPAAGTYTQAQNVSISCSTEGATIYYTTNGQDPTLNSTVYSGAINVSTNTTIKAMAAKSGYDNSAVVTAEYAFITLEHAGTLADPYTVADARTAIDAGIGTQNVYATGVVSAIPTAWNSQYSNITFNFVDNDGDNNFLQAYHCTSGTGVDASQVAVGDEVVVYGNLIKFGSTYEFSQGCQVVSLTHPSVPFIILTPATLNVDAQQHLVNYLDLAYENIDVENGSSFTVHYYNAEGDEIQVVPGETWMIAGVAKPNDVYQVLCTIIANEGEARTAYFKLSALDAENNTVYSNLVTVNQEAYVAPTYAELPFSFNGVKADIESTDGLYEEGLATDYNATNYPTTKLKFDSTGDWLLLQFDERPGTLTFNIKGNSFSGSTFALQTSENGVDFTTLKSYTNNNFGEDVYPEEFTDLGENIRYIKWVYTTKASGNVGLGNIALAKYVEPQQYTLTVEPFENLDLITFVNDEMVMAGEGEIQVVEGDQIMLSVVALEGFEMETLMVNSVDHVNDIADDFTYSFEMPAENVTISATAVEDVPQTPGEWVMVSLNDLTENDVFVIVGVYDEDESSFAMANNSTNAPSAVDVMMVGNTLSGDIAENLKWNLSIGEDGYTFYPNGETESWLFCNRTNNGVRVGTNENNVFTMTPEGYLFNNATSRYIGIYNRQDWRSYTSINNNIKEQTFAFYKRVDEGSLVTYTLDIKGYESDTTGGWHLIASPVSMIRPTAENGFLTDEYDLYRFDQTNEKEWRNYKKNHFNLVSGHGYLYASQENTTLTFTGVPCTGNRKEVEVTYDENAVLAGFNLVGNPFTTEAILVDANGTALAYLKMNEDGNGFTAVDPGEPIAEMEAVFYQATPNDNSVYFSTEYRTAKSSHLNMTVNQGRGTVDNAIIRFDKGNTLEKFSFREGSTKVYIPQDGKDYAVVNAEGEGEMPISFQAENNGTYSLSFSTKYVEFSYLHLIDNLTGADIDLLATPSYSFEANTTDYASRFRLVFSTSNTDSDNFAFISNGQIIINGQGSTVQVYDVTGRMIGSHNNVNHIATEGMSAGVYMLRLVNGNDVKTQKIVVK